MKKLIFLFGILLFISCKEDTKKVEIVSATIPKTEVAAKKSIISENAMVVSAREEASKIGIEILKKGEMHLMR